MPGSLTLKTGEGVLWNKEETEKGLKYWWQEKNAHISHPTNLKHAFIYEPPFIFIKITWVYLEPLLQIPLIILIFTAVILLKDLN